MRVRDRQRPVESGLRPVIAVHFRSASRSTGFNRHCERGVDHRCGRTAVKGPTDGPSAPGVEDATAIELSLASGVFGDVGHPELVRAVAMEVPIDQVLGGHLLRQVPLAASPGEKAGYAEFAHPKRARLHLHCTPASSSWLNLVEGWFAQLTNRRLTNGAFSSVQHLENEIGIWAERWHEDPKPFIWKKPAKVIITKVRRGRATFSLVNSKTDHLSASPEASCPMYQRPTSTQSNVICEFRALLS